MSYQITKSPHVNTVFWTTICKQSFNYILTIYYDIVTYVAKIMEVASYVAIGNICLPKFYCN